MILTCQNIEKSFGENTILKDISFHIDHYEKAAIVGINGAGKSTLLKIIMGQLSKDAGLVTFGKGVSIGYLAQNDSLHSNRSIFEELLSVKSDLIELEENIRNMELQMKHADGSTLSDLMTAYSNATHRFEQSNGYAYKSEVIGVLKGLGFEEADFTRTTDTLSGGQKTRVALAKLLLEQPDCIVLDEPTNHLDIGAISWLETYLSNYKGAVLIVSHDRFFLDRVVNKIIEIEASSATVYSGNYSDYAKKREAIRHAELTAYMNQQREIKHHQEVIDKLKSFNREKSIKRAESREKALDKIDILSKPQEISTKMNIHLDPEILSGNDVLQIEDLSKSYAKLHLFEGLHLDIKRGEHVAIIGNNGTGKTTLLKILNGLVEADQGSITLGSKVSVAYYDQEQKLLDPSKTLFDEISDAYPHLSNTKIRNTLAAFSFLGDEVFKQISMLSGGEKGRLSLAKLMLSNANFIILDEPTNHLDIASKEILEDALNNYTGTLLYISHDRYFINRTASRIVELENKTLQNFLGNYDYYLEKKVPITIPTENVEIESSESKLDWKEKKEEQSKLRKRQNDLTKCENKIHDLELQLAAIDTKMQDPNIACNVSELTALSKEQEQINKLLEEQMLLWEELC